MRRLGRTGIAAVIATATAMALTLASPASATWTAGADSAARGRGGVIPQVAKPTPVRVNGIRVTVNWVAVAVTEGVTYQVLRNGAAIVSGTCSAPVAGTSCSDTFAIGAHTYTVTAKLQQWSGLVSLPSDSI